MLSGVISNIQKYSLQDGPGIRTTVFLKGCPLECAWCHNPENLSPQPEVLVFPTRCVRCGACRVVCPQRQAAVSKGRLAAEGEASAPSDKVRCLTCGACVEACPTGARVMVGARLSVDELMAHLRADRIFYDDSAGGVTFSGGEPLRQPEFLEAALAACRTEGLHTAVDTCGFAPMEELESVAARADLFLYDLKLMDEARHLEFCGVSNRLILENLRKLAGRHHNIWIRVPLIPGVNDAPGDLQAMAAFIAALPGVRRVDLLPYHRTGVHKFEQLGRRYRLGDLPTPTPADVQAALACFTAAGLSATAGG